MNTALTLPPHKLATASFRANVLKGRAFLQPSPQLLQTSSTQCGGLSHHLIRAEALPRPLTLILQPAASQAPQLTYVGGMQPTATVHVSQAQQLPPALVVLNLSQLRYFTYALLLLQGVHAHVISPQVRNVLQQLPSQTPEDAFFNLLQALHALGPTALLDFNPASAARTLAFADTAHLRANRPTMEAIRPMFRTTF